MRITLNICVLLLVAQAVSATEPPQIAVTTNLVAPPEFRSYKRTITFKRGETDIMQDIEYGPASSKTEHMQHIVHNGNIVYTVRGLGCGYTKYIQSQSVSISETDINGDGKPDLLCLMPIGSNEIIEAFIFADGKFLSPLSSDDLFDGQGRKLSHADVISRITKKISQQSSGGDVLKAAPQK